MLALALPAGGKLVCCDVSEEWTAIARRYWKAGGERKIDLRIGPALDTLKMLRGRFDCAFIDADKPNYWRYYQRCLQLVRKGGLINRRVERDRRVDIALVPIGDGLTPAVKR